MGRTHLCAVGGAGLIFRRTNVGMPLVASRRTDVAILPNLMRSPLILPPQRCQVRDNLAAVKWKLGWRAVLLLMRESLRAWVVRGALFSALLTVFAVGAVSRFTRAPFATRDSARLFFSRVVAESVSWGVLLLVAVALALTVYARDRASGARALLAMRGLASYYGLLRTIANSGILLLVALLSTAAELVLVRVTRGAWSDHVLLVLLQTSVCALALGALTTASMGLRGKLGAYLVYFIGLALPEYLHGITSRVMPNEVTSLPRLFRLGWLDPSAGLRALVALVILIVLSTYVAQRRGRHDSSELPT
jgi:hypothetical protein